MEDRIARIDAQAAALCDSAGTGTVVGNLTGVLTDLFGSVAVAIVALMIFRDDLRARLRRDRPAGIPLPEAEAVRKAVATVLAGVLQQPAMGPAGPSR